MKVQFRGTISGDHESFFWAVDFDTYKRITGNRPDPYKIVKFKKRSDGKPLYELSPDDVFESIQGEHEFTIEVK